MTHRTETITVAGQSREVAYEILPKTRFTSEAMIAKGKAEFAAAGIKIEGHNITVVDDVCIVILADGYDQQFIATLDEAAKEWKIFRKGLEVESRPIGMKTIYNTNRHATCTLYDAKTNVSWSYQYDATSDLAIDMMADARTAWLKENNYYIDWN